MKAEEDGHVLRLKVKGRDGSQRGHGRRWLRKKA